MRKEEEQDRSLPLGYYTQAHPVTKLYIPIIHRASSLQTSTTVRLASIGGSQHGCLIVPHELAASEQGLA